MDERPGGRRSRLANRMTDCSAGIESYVKSIDEKLNKIEEVGLRTGEEAKTKQVERDIMCQAAVYNQIYITCTGSSLFDDRAGNCKPTCLFAPWANLASMAANNTYRRLQ